MALPLELGGKIANGVIALAMNHHQRLLAPSDLEDLEELVVAEDEIVIRHEDFERGVAVLDQRRQFLAEHKPGGVGDDQMEGGVDIALALRRFTSSKRESRNLGRRSLSC